MHIEPDQTNNTSHCLRAICIGSTTKRSTTNGSRHMVHAVLIPAIFWGNEPPKNPKSPPEKHPEHTQK